jgi:hypothetical protein
MKKILFILFLSLVACKKVEVIPQPEPTPIDIFSVNEVTLTNGQDFNFTLKSGGVHIITLFDSTNQQVVTKEKINGIVGNNTKKIYTKSLSQKSLYLYIVNENNQEIGRTLIKIQ